MRLNLWEFKFQLFLYKNLRQIASKTFAKQCSFIDDLKHNFLNKTTCRMSSANPELKLFARCSLLVPFCSLLVTFCSLLVTFCSLLVTFCSLLVLFCLLLVTFCSLLVTFCLLLVTFCSLLVTFYSLFVTFSLLDKKF